MNIGLVILDRANGQMSTLSEIAPDFTSENITTILPARDGTIWIGTYGEGLWAWTPEKNSLHRYSKGAEIADDWILSGCETDRTESASPVSISNLTAASIHSGFR